MLYLTSFSLTNVLELSSWQTVVANVAVVVVSVAIM